MSSETLYWILLTLCIIISAFFSSSETAFISLERYRLQHLVESGKKGAVLVAKMLERPERILSTILLGNNLVNTAAAAIGTVLAVSYWGEERGVALSTIMVTVLLLIFAETTPKTFASRNAEKLVFIVARPIQVFSWIFYPVVALLSLIAGGITRIIGGDNARQLLASPEEIKAMITVGSREGSVEKGEAQLLHAVFEFGDNPVFEVMVPRTEIIAVGKGTTLNDFLKIYSEFPLSRFPVYEENLDNIIGILSIKDVLMAIAKDSSSLDNPVEEFMRPAYFTPETKKVSELFTEMKENNFRMCVVIDEYGGTAGIVSLSRLMEEIVGPVGDELAAAEKEYETINEYTFQIDGGMRIEEANEELGLNLPEGDYETVAGFILSFLGKFPRQGQVLRYNGLKIVVTRMKGKKIEEILITQEAKQQNAAASD
ncbi:MAG: hemolysin family protein [Limnochordia bacterium]|nr:hemolysin family protein [Limnochordia bacterium]